MLESSALRVNSPELLVTMTSAGLEGELHREREGQSRSMGEILAGRRSISLLQGPPLCLAPLLSTDPGVGAFSLKTAGQGTALKILFGLPTGKTTADDTLPILLEHRQEEIRAKKDFYQ